MRLSTIPGADDRDAILLDLEDGDLFVTARIDGAHTSVQMDARAVDRLIRDLQRWRYVSASWEDRATPHFQIDEDGKVTQLLPLQRRVDDMAKLLQVEVGYAWPAHATEERAHHSCVPGNEDYKPHRAAVRTAEEGEIAEAFAAAVRRALRLTGEEDVEWRDPVPMTRRKYLDAVAKLDETLHIDPDGVG